MKKILMASTLTSIVMLSGCATLLGGGSSQKIKFVTTKEMPATLYEIPAEDNSTKKPEEVQKMTIPATITVSRGNHNFLLKSNNGEFKDVKIKKKWNPMGWGNFIPIGAINFMFTTTDAVSGAMWKYDDNIAVSPEK